MRMYLIAIASIFSFSSALAGPTTWTGFYAGAHGGYSWADWDGSLFSTTHAPPNQAYAFNPSNVTLDGEGWSGGLQAGYNEQFGAWVFGIEVDASRTDVDAGGRFRNINQSFDWTVQTEMEWFGTLRGRVGWADQNMLVYATGGLAYARTEGSLVSTQLQCPTCPRTTATGSSDEDHFGYVIGGGIEWRVSRFWTIKSEYLYADLGSEDYHMVGTETLTGNPHITDSFPADLEVQTFRIGVNYDLTD